MYGTIGIPKGNPPEAGRYGKKLLGLVTNPQSSRILSIITKRTVA